VNALGLALWASVVHATVFALLASVLYVFLRRIGPAAGALCALAGLLVMALVSVIVLCPWPRWPGAAGEWHGRLARLIPASGTAEADRMLQSIRLGSAALFRAADAQGAHGADDVQVAKLSLAPVGPEANSPASSGTSPETSALWSRLESWPWPACLAAAILAGLSIGAARLLMGLLAVRRLRYGSRAIDDAELYDLLEILRAELCCSRKVEVRESHDLTTPAVTGWRRPMLLLPFDWRDWTPDQRRAVLAHELAHVCRGDFAAALAAQVCVALQFYHPLAHWLVARLRLEQELAADAWGARLAGGRQTYLAALAELALRRDTKPLRWPARAFMPTHHTFLRRIHMLRKNGSIRHTALPLYARVLTVASLGALGLIVAGFRGPDSGDALGGPQVAGSGQGSAQGASRVAPDPAPAPFELKYLPPDTKMVLAVQPAALVRRDDLRRLLESAWQEHAVLRGIKTFKPEDVQQLMLFWEASSQGPTEGSRPILVPPPSGWILQSASATDWGRALSQNGAAGNAVHFHGQTYYRLGASGMGSLCGHAPDDRTLVVAPEDLMRELIAERNAPQSPFPWDECWKRVAPGHVMMGLESRWLRRRLAREFPSGPGGGTGALLSIDTMAPLLDNTDAYALSLDATAQFTVDAVAAAHAEESAKPVAETAQAMLTLMRNALSSQAQKLEGDPRSAGAAGPWSPFVRSLLEKARLDVTGRFVHLRALAASGVGNGITPLASAITAASERARRATSINHLKQIGLAFHNYHSQNGRLPTPVLYGGRSGKIPYSWRVAILPYLAEQKLYSQYNFDEPWDGPNNIKLLNKMPAVYAYPEPEVGRGRASATTAAYFVFTGPQGALAEAEDVKTDSKVPPTFFQITDGISNTILAVEAKREIPWTQPEDIPLSAGVPLPKLGGFARGGFDALFGDGSVRFIRDSVPETVLRALLTRDGGEVISADSY
jgi:beta-lactamase regulating signal transducer with metallopeptidase domain